MSDKYVSLEWSFVRDKSTTMHEKLIYSEIRQLSMLDKGCVANNEHFAALMGIKKTAVSRCLKNLENKGYIRTKITKGSRNHDRTITINKMLTPPKQNVIYPLTKCYESKENNTINNTVKGEKLIYPKSLDVKNWEKYLEHRRAYKFKKLKPHSEQQLINILSKLPLENQRMCVDETCRNGWQGLFPEKHQDKPQTNKSPVVQELITRLTGSRINPAPFKLAESEQAWRKLPPNKWDFRNEYEMNKAIQESIL